MRHVSRHWRDSVLCWSILHKKMLQVNRCILRSERTSSVPVEQMVARFLERERTTPFEKNQVMDFLMSMMRHESYFVRIRAVEVLDAMKEKVVNIAPRLMACADEHWPATPIDQLPPLPTWVSPYDPVKWCSAEPKSTSPETPASSAPRSDDDGSGGGGGVSSSVVADPPTPSPLNPAPPPAPTSSPSSSTIMRPPTPETWTRKAVAMALSSLMRGQHLANDTTGAENTLDVIFRVLGDDSPEVCRAAMEGLWWMSRNKFDALKSYVDSRVVERTKDQLARMCHRQRLRLERGSREESGERTLLASARVLLKSLETGLQLKFDLT